jgi:CDP-glycerol glycerophosphotransferase (TagB/SpsB family)
MMRCKLLITDYSSVCWDVFYQGKPVIFYQFDTEQYNEAHGSYIDLETDLFGDRVEKQEELFAVMEEYIQNGFTLKEKYQKMRPDCYKYIDKNNSQRICEEIIKRGW